MSHHINILHDNDIYYTTKNVFIHGEVDEQSFVKDLKNLHIADQSTGLVTITLTTEGGSVEHGLALYDAIRAMKNRVRIIGYGGVCSIGSVIFQAGDERYMMPNSYLMTHYGDSGVVGHPNNKKAWEKLLEHFEERTQQIYLSRIREKKPRYKKSSLENDLLLFDTIFLPKRAIEFGLCDYIMENEY